MPHTCNKNKVKLFPLFGFSRALASIRREFPVLWFLPGFIAGQVLAYFFSWKSLILPFILIVIYMASRKRWKFWKVTPLYFISLLPGIISMKAALPAESNLQNDASYLAEVEAEPRHRKPGLVEFSLNILGRVDRSQILKHGRVGAKEEVRQKLRIAVSRSAPKTLHSEALI